MKNILLVSLFSILLTIAGTGCAAKCPPIFKDVEQSDLAPGTAFLFDQYPNRFYAIPSNRKTDVYVLLLRSNLLQEYGNRDPMKALLSLGSVIDKPDCSEIQRKLGNHKWEEARTALNGSFFCFDSLLTQDEVIARNPILAADSINNSPEVDAHVGWYSATGDKQPIEKLVRNLAQNERSCACIPWPLASISREDTLFASFVREEAAKYPDSEKIKGLLGQIEGNR